MKDIKSPLRKSEFILLISGCVLALILLITGLLTQRFYIGIIVGYTLGFSSFIMLVKVYGSSSQLPRWLTVMGILLGNFKLLFLGLLIAFFYKMGISLKEMVIGIIISQLALIPAIYLSLRADAENAESLKKNN